MQVNISAMLCDKRTVCPDVPPPWQLTGINIAGRNAPRSKARSRREKTLMQQTFKPLYTSKSGGALHYVCYCTVLLVGQNAQIIVFLLVGSLIGVTSNWCPGLTCSSSWWTIATRSPTMPSHVESSIFTQSWKRVWNDFTQRTRFVNAFPGSE